MRRVRVASGVVCGLATASLLAAHDTWLSPAAGQGPGKSLRFHLTSGGHFPATDHGIEPGRVAAAHLRLAGQTLPLTPVSRRADVLVLQAPGANSGLATAWVALKPRPLALTAALVAEYLHEIGEQDRIGERWARVPEPRKWRETYRKHAKTFVAMGDPARADDSWREPVGLLLEIVPEASPASLAVGDTLAVRVLKKGVPLPGLSLRAARKGSAGTTQRTDDGGRASFRLDAAGSWLVAGTDLRESAARPGEWESDFTTLTLEVGPARRH